MSEQDDFAYRSAHEIAAGIRSRQFSPVEVLAVERVRPWAAHYAVPAARPR